MASLRNEGIPKQPSVDSTSLQNALQGVSNP